MTLSVSQRPLNQMYYYFLLIRAAQYWKKLTALYFFPLILNISGKYYLALFKEKYNMLKIWMQAEKSPL